MKQDGVITNMYFHYCQSDIPIILLEAIYMILLVGILKHLVYIM